MCGINLILSKEPISKNALPAMQETTLYRGPDNSEEYYYQQKNWFLALGVNRLMVVDRDKSSNQPMVSDCGNFVLAYNGEVYNYQELKNRLIKKGVVFRTHSDTEVVLYWLKEYGVIETSLLRGMFSFVFVDLLNKSVYISRDKQGIKPLYFQKNNDTIVISSSIRAIQESGVFGQSVNDNAVQEYLSFRHVLGRKTFFNEINSIEPGSPTEIKSDFSWKSIDFSPTEDIAPMDLRESLIEAVTLQNSSKDVPGLMLSGGVDSTLLLAILNKELSISGVPTYALNTGPDTKWAAKAAYQYQADHHQVDLELNNPEIINEFLLLTDQPIADHGAFASWFLAKEVKKQRNVLLSGAGADELFGGYNRHRAFYQYLNNPKKALLLKSFLKVLRIINLLPKGYTKALNAISYDPSKTFQNFLKSYSIIDNNDDIELFMSSEDPDEKFISTLRYDQKNYLINDVLTITDNASMQQAVEVRLPFLYDAVVSRAERYSAAELMRVKGKAPLKDLLRTYDGKSFINRPKMGFGLPMADLVRKREWQGLWEFLERDNPIYRYVPKNHIKTLLSEHLHEKTDNNMQLWSILVLENWLSRI